MYPTVNHFMIIENHSNRREVWSISLQLQVTRLQNSHKAEPLPTPTSHRVLILGHLLVKYENARRQKGLEIALANHARALWPGDRNLHQRACHRFSGCRSYLA